MASTHVKYSKTLKVCGVIHKKNTKLEVKCLNTVMKYGTGGMGAFLNVHIQISSGFCDGNFDNR